MASFNSPGNLDKWRDYFRTASSDIFDIIEHAVMVAATDCPKEFQLRRDRIAEMLFTCKVTRCFGCDKVELAVPNSIGGCGEKSGDQHQIHGNDKCKSSKFIFQGGASKESKVNSSSRDDNDHDDDDDENDDDHQGINNGVAGGGGEMEMNATQQVSNYSYGEAEAMTDEIEEESQIVGEVMRIKEILDNYEDESDAVLYDSVRRLELMALSVETLKATEIGKSVNALKKHGSKKIRYLVRKLIDDWKLMVDQWVSATAALAVTESTPESMKTSVLDEEEGLPSPPMDEGALFTTPTSMELSQFFDGMDDDGNPRNSGEFNKSHENGRRPPLQTQNICKQQLHYTLDNPAKDRIVEQPKKQEEVVKKQSSVLRPNKPPVGSGPGRPTKPSAEPKAYHDVKFRQRSDEDAIQKKPLVGPKDKLRSDDVAVQKKLEATKRKLQERYQQAENAKKQRTIQVMELRDLPKQGLVQRNAHLRPGNQGRHWGNGRR